MFFWGGEGGGKGGGGGAVCNAMLLHVTINTCHFDTMLIEPTKTSRTFTIYKE